MEPKTANQINKPQLGQFDPDLLPVAIPADFVSLKRENARLERAMREAIKLLAQGNPHQAEIILAETLKEDGE